MPKVLCVKNDSSDSSNLPFDIQAVEVTYVSDCSTALQMLRKHDYDGLYYCGTGNHLSMIDLVQSSEILDWVPDGLALLDESNKILKANKRLTNWFEGTLVGLDFYQAIGQPDIVGPEHSPLATARSQTTPCDATLQLGERFFKLSAIPVVSDGECKQLMVKMADATRHVMLQQKTEALHKAGTALADLRPEEIYQMGVEERIDLLKDNILHYTNDLLDFDVIEIRLLDKETNLLEPLLSVGIDSEEASKPLFAERSGNGVTGFVAATGQSYKCEDTASDPIYVDGLMGAKSSLTVPLIYHEEVIGSFNVESPEINAFDDSDLHFLESFARDVAVSLNTLELLNAQRTDAAIQSVSAIREAVAAPINEILNDTVNAIARSTGDDEEVERRLRTILKHAREIKKVIQQVGEEMAPDEHVPACVQLEIRPALKGKNVLVIDAEEEVRRSARQLLGRHGVDVETAHEGEEALNMVRNCDFQSGYDAIIADIRLPDIGGYDLLLRLREFLDSPPLILMTGYGYDPTHAIVKARESGLPSFAVIAKPLRNEQLIGAVEKMVLGNTPSMANDG